MSRGYTGPRTPSMRRREPIPARIPTPDYFRGKCVAITSLSPNPERQERQHLCLESWRDIGLHVIVVNTTSEINCCSIQEPWIEFFESENVATEYDRPTQRISTLINVGRKNKLPFLLINSDVEICGDNSVIESALQEDCKLTIGIRYNHTPGKSRNSGKPERYGMDCFLMTPEMAATVPDMQFAIGKPVWDYWIPYHFRNLRCKFNWIKTPFFFHESHTLGWSQDDWSMGAEWMRKAYEVNVGDATFRDLLEKA